LFQKRSTLTPTEEIFAIWRERGEKIVSNNSKCIRISVGGLISNFLHGGGMDVFWNNTIQSINNLFKVPTIILRPLQEIWRLTLYKDHLSPPKGTISESKYLWEG
jgi:hypothetical protein